MTRRRWDLAALAVLAGVTVGAVTYALTSMESSDGPPLIVQRLIDSAPKL